MQGESELRNKRKRKGKVIVQTAGANGCSSTESVQWWLVEVNETEMSLNICTWDDLWCVAMVTK